MYAKCESMADAWRLFSKMLSHNEVSWNAMFGGYAMVGHGTEAFAHFEQMCEEGVQISQVTFVCIISCCNR
jgi:pentatricopeptide repeat protein